MTSSDTHLNLYAFQPKGELFKGLLSENDAVWEPHTFKQLHTIIDHILLRYVSFPLTVILLRSHSILAN